MKESEVIYELKSFLRRYKACKQKERSEAFANMMVSLGERNAVAYALDILEKLNTAKVNEDNYPNNVYSLLGFEANQNLTDAQLHGFDYIMTEILSELEAGLIEARYRDKKKTREIAEMYGVSYKTLGSRIKRIVDMLKTPKYLAILSGGMLPSDGNMQSISSKNEYLVLYNRRLMDTSIDGEQHIKIDDLDLSERAYHILTRNGIWYVDDLKDWDYEKLLNIRNCGIHTVEEIVSKAAEYGINIKKRAKSKD